MKILQADDHPLFRTIIQQILIPLDKNITFLEACTASEAIQLLAKNRDINLVLLDLIMPGMEELAGFYTIRKKYPKIPVAIISGCQNVSEMRTVIRAGASGYIPKTEPREIMLGAIQLILAGGVYIPPHIHAGLDDQKRLINELTHRQREVLEFLGEGYCNKEIARRLKLEEGTVKQHVSRVLRFLDVSNRTQAVIKIRKMKGLE